MKFQSAGREIMLIGVKDNTSMCLVVSDTRLKGLLKKNVVSHWVELFVLPQEESSHQVMHLFESAGIPQLVQNLLSEY
jgi:hypothetical protein